MTSALLHLLPIAIAVAVSSVPITATILILLSPNRDRSGVPFLVGWLSGMAVVVTASALGAHALPVRPSRSNPDAIGLAEVIVGSALVVYGVIEFVRRRVQTTERGKNWLDAVGSMGPVGAFWLAFALNLRPKGLLLGVAAGLAVTGDTESFVQAVLAAVFYVAIAGSSVGVPIVATLASPAQMEPRLIAANDWIGRNSQALTALILVLVGLAVVAVGLERL